MSPSYGGRPPLFEGPRQKRSVTLTLDAIAVVERERESLREVAGGLATFSAAVESLILRAGPPVSE